MTFTGFTEAALDFYDDLELDNTKAFWDANKHVYAEAVRAPMVALTEALADEFGAAKLFRPHRDVRFSKDKTPIKTHQGAVVQVVPGTGWYVAISAAGVFVGAGFTSGVPAQIAAVREGIDDSRRGPALQRLVDGLVAEGLEVGGEKLKTAPRGFAPDHPRIELLRHKTFTIGRDYDHTEPAFYTPTWSRSSAPTGSGSARSWSGSPANCAARPSAWLRKLRSDHGNSPLHTGDLPWGG